MALAALLAGCGSLPQVERLREAQRVGGLDLPPAVELAEVPFFPQEEYQCGPAALATTLVASGVATSATELAGEVYLPERQGSLQVEMLAAARRHQRIAYELAPSLIDVLREVAAGNPVIVLHNTGIRPLPFWHYAVVVGYDLESREVVMRSGRRQRQRMPFTAFDFFWRDGKYWAMVTMPPQRLPITATETRYGAAVAAVERLGHAAAANAAYAAMLARWPESYVALMGLGNTHHAGGRLAAAEAAFRRAAQGKPEEAAAWNNLAQTLADQGRWREALEPARRAVALGGPLAAATRATLAAIERGIENAVPPAPTLLPADAPAAQPDLSNAASGKKRKKKARRP